MTEQTAVIADFDGALCDVSSVRHHVLSQPKDFELFHLEARGCPPHRESLDWCERAVADGHVVIVATGRKEKFRGITVSWLNEHMPVPYHGPIMRADDDGRPDTEVKTDMYDHLVTQLGFRIVAAMDDAPHIVELWRSFGIPTYHVPGWDHWVDAQAKGGNLEMKGDYR